MHFESERVEVLLADNSNAFDYGHTVELFEQDGYISPFDVQAATQSVQICSILFGLPGPLAII